MMKELPEWLTKVTPATRITAAVVFIFIPFFSFFLGLQFGVKVHGLNNVPIIPDVVQDNSFDYDVKNIDANYTGWSDNRSDTFDINFKLPKDWKVFNSKLGSIPCDMVNQELKNPTNCKNTLDANYIMLYNDNDYKEVNEPVAGILSFPKNVVFINSTTANGSANSICSTSEKGCGSEKVLQINFLQKDFDLYMENKINSGFVRGDVNAGSKSIYKSFGVQLAAQDNENYTNAIKIIKSLKY